MNTSGIPNKISFIDVLVQMIEAVEEMHRCGFIHQDIKLDNYRIMNNLVVLIDFGLTDLYVDKDGKHKNLWRQGFQGTPFNGSVQALQGYQLARRDDISSLGFAIIQLINPEQSKVPWANLKQDAHLGEFLKRKCEFLKLEGGDEYFEFSMDPTAARNPCDSNHP